MANPFRLGFLTHVRGPVEPKQLYQETLKLFEVADELGYDVGWVAQHHFKAAGMLPSPFPFLAAAAERTRRLRLGIAIVTLPFEVPLRVAEDAAVVDLLSGGRLELGVGSGIDPAEFEVFGVELSSRHERTTAGLNILKRAFQGEPLGPSGQQLQPPAPTLAHRLWLSGLSEVGAQYAARQEVGLLLSRAAWASEAPTDVVQLPVAKAYLAEWQHPGRKPRLGLSRGVYVAAGKAAALAEIRQDVLQAMEPMIKRGRMPPDQPLDYYCKRLHLAYGHPDEVATALSADQVLPYSNDLILQFDPIFPTLERTIQMLEQLATQVAPLLGWQPGAS